MKWVWNIGTAVLVGLPIVAILLLSLVNQWGYPSLLGHFTLDNWRNTLGGAEGLGTSFLLSLFLSATISLTSTTAGFIFSRNIAYSTQKKWLLPLAYYPYLVAPVVLGIVWQYFFLQAGLSGRLWGVVLAQFLFAFPYSVLLFAGYWGKEIKDMEQQAVNLGADGWQVYRKVLIPAARGWIFISLFQTFLLSWFEYGLTSVVGIGKVPTLTLRTMVYVKEANPHYAAVAACLMVLPLLALLLVNRSIFAQKSIARD